MKFSETDQTVQMHYTDIYNLDIKVNIINIKIVYESVFQ